MNNSVTKVAHVTVVMSVIIPHKYLCLPVMRTTLSLNPKSARSMQDMFVAYCVLREGGCVSVWEVGLLSTPCTWRLIYLPGILQVTTAELLQVSYRYM